MSLLGKKTIGVTTTPSEVSTPSFGGATHYPSRTNKTIHKPKNPIITRPYRSIRFVRGFCKLWIVGWPWVSMHDRRSLKNLVLLHGFHQPATERKPPFWILEWPPAMIFFDTSYSIVTCFDQRAKRTHSIFLSRKSPQLRNFKFARRFSFLKQVMTFL